MAKRTQKQRIERLIRIIDLCASEFEEIYPNPTEEQEDWAEGFDSSLRALEEALERDVARERANEIEPIDTPDEDGGIFPRIVRVRDSTPLTEGSGMFHLGRNPEQNNEILIEIAPANASDQEYFDRHWYEGATFRIGGLIEFQLVADVRSHGYKYSAVIDFNTDNYVSFSCSYSIRAVEVDEEDEVEENTITDSHLTLEQQQEIRDRVQQEEHSVTSDGEPPASRIDDNSVNRQYLSFILGRYRRSSLNETLIRESDCYQLVRQPQHQFRIRIAPVNSRSVYFDRYWTLGSEFTLVSDTEDMLVFELMADVVSNADGLYSADINFRAGREPLMNYWYNLHVFGEYQTIENGTILRLPGLPSDRNIMSDIPVQSIPPFPAHGPPGRIDISEWEMITDPTFTPRHYIHRETPALEPYQYVLTSANRLILGFPDQLNWQAGTEIIMSPDIRVRLESDVQFRTYPNVNIYEAFVSPYVGGGTDTE